MKVKTEIQELIKTKEEMNKDFSKVFDGVVKDVNEADLQLTFIASDESVDRHNDVILQSGWNLVNFMKNPVFLQGHWSFDLPIGRVINATVDQVNKQLIITVQFSKTYSYSQTIFNLYKEKIMNSVSVGFRPTKWKWKDETPEGEWMWDPADRVFVEQELLEVSAVSIPANVNANIIRSFKGMGDEQKEQMLRDVKVQKALDYYQKNQPLMKQYHKFYEKITDMLNVERGEDLGEGLEKVLLTVKENLNMIKYLKNDQSEEMEIPDPKENPEAEDYTPEIEESLINEVLKEI